MDAVTYMKAQKAIKIKEKKLAQQNQWIKQNRDHIGFHAPKGTKERIYAAGIKSISGYINALIEKDLAEREALMETDELRCDTQSSDNV